MIIRCTWHHWQIHSDYIKWHILHCFAVLKKANSLTRLWTDHWQSECREAGFLGNFVFPTIFLPAAPLMGQPSETVHHKDLYHCTNLINILVMHLLLSAHLVVVMNTDDMGPTYELLTTGRCNQQSLGRCKRGRVGGRHYVLAIM